MRKAFLFFVLLLFVSASFAQTEIAKENIAGKLAGLYLSDAGIFFTSFKSYSTFESVLPFSTISLKNISFATPKQTIVLVPVEETKSQAPLQCTMDFSSMNVPESVIGITCPVQNVIIGFSAETLYIVDWKEAQLDERIGFENKAYPLKQVQYTPLHPRIFKLTISLNF